MIGLAAVVVPTLIRVAVQNSVSMAVFLTYVPFMLVAALFLKPSASALVAATSAMIADIVFMEPFFALNLALNGVFSVAAFLMISLLFILFVRSVRGLLRHSLAPETPEFSRNPIFSEKQGEAWVSWRSERPSVKLGSHTEVAEMMEDYIAQVELAQRMTQQMDKPHT